MIRYDPVTAYDTWPVEPGIRSFCASPSTSGILSLKYHLPKTLSPRLISMPGVLEVTVLPFTRREVVVSGRVADSRPECCPAGGTRMLLHRTSALAAHKSTRPPPSRGGSESRWRGIGHRRFARTVMRPATGAAPHPRCPVQADARRVVTNIDARRRLPMHSRWRSPMCVH